MSHQTEQDRTIGRREAIRRVTALLGGATLIGGTTLIAACNRERTATSAAGYGTFTSADIAWLDEVADTIVPTTATPGAKAAAVGHFMAVMVTDTYDPKDQQIFRAGMTQLEDAARKAHGADFLAATPAQRLALLETLDREQKAYQDAKKGSDPNHFFRMMKELTLVGYFTSEIGVTQAMRYRESPGRFDPCVPYTAGETIWASHA
ncbi:MAG: gluconate 2-dehydrogenase subunit 3 family protein [Gemmatimonadaceae bacterium]|nr:gluconate 2-dehydrogenase subunit 3 family protein [Gemmatimonadaceae bacterium]